MGILGRNEYSALSLSILKQSWQKLELTLASCIICNHGSYHVKARLVDLIGSSGIENATSAQPKNLASAPRLSPLRFFGGVAGDETRKVREALTTAAPGCYAVRILIVLIPERFNYT